MERFSKPALTYQQQVDLLKSRGLIIDNEKRAIRHLKNISYYRLSAYMLPFKKVDDQKKHIDSFTEGTKWDDIYNMYRFDRKFRLLIFDAIERIEISLRTQLIYQLSHKYGSHWHTEKRIFKAITRKDKTTGQIVPRDIYSEINQHLQEQLKSNKSTEFIKHYLSKYYDPPTPPSWMSVEIMYFNQLSLILNSLKDKKDISDLADFYGLPNEIFCSWIHTINYIRNICAHHARLWNIKIQVNPSKLKYSKSKIWITNPEIVQSSKIYYFMCMILYMLQTINPNSKFKMHFFELLTSFPIINEKYMGFPDNWKLEAIWK